MIVENNSMLLESKKNYVPMKLLNILPAFSHSLLRSVTFGKPIIYNVSDIVRY